MWSWWARVWGYKDHGVELVDQGVGLVDHGVGLVDHGVVCGTKRRLGGS